MTSPKHVWFTSDDHFSHENVIKYTNRPFSSVEEMNEALLEGINSTVKKDDILYNLGDFAFGGKSRAREFAKKIKCKHHNIVLGNHDEASTRWYMENGFEWASRFPVVFADFLILSHAPLFIQPGSPYVNLHGHCHSNLFDIHSKTHLNLCVENWNYTPVSLDQVQEILRENLGEKSKDLGKRTNLYGHVTTEKT